jgi:hypothetical protein
VRVRQRGHPHRRRRRRRSRCRVVSAPALAPVSTSMSAPGSAGPCASQIISGHVIARHRRRHNFPGDAGRNTYYEAWPKARRPSLGTIHGTCCI